MLNYKFSLKKGNKLTISNAYIALKILDLDKSPLDKCPTNYGRATTRYWEPVTRNRKMPQKFKIKSATLFWKISNLVDFSQFDKVISSSDPGFNTLQDVKKRP